MTQFPAHFLAAQLAQPWYARPEMVVAHFQRLQQGGVGVPPASAPVGGAPIPANAARMAALPVPMASAPAPLSAGEALEDVEIYPGGLAVVRVSGMMLNCEDPDGILSWFGCCSTPELLRTVSALPFVPDVKSVLFVIDSPGGQASGIADLAVRIEELSALHGKKTVAWTPGMMCSAAYFCGAACQTVLAAPDAEVGSVGCIVSMVDDSAMWEQVGLKRVAVVSDGADGKLLGMPGLPITAEQQAFVKERCNYYGLTFRGYVQGRRSLAEADINGLSWPAQMSPAGYVDYTSVTDAATARQRALALEEEVLALLLDGAF